MIRLVGAELNRLLSRRVTLILGLVVVAVIGVFQIGVAQAVSPPSPESVAQAREAYERDLQQWQEDHEEWKQGCLEDGGAEEECTFPAPTEQDYGLVPTPYAGIASAGAIFSVVLTMLAGYLVGASFIGAEYSSGSLGNWLTFVPRRGRVFASKAIALALGSAAFATLTGALMVGVAAIVTAIVGQPVTGAGPVVAIAARGIGLAVFAAALGFSLSMLTGYTVAALGALLGYGIVVLGLNILSYLVPALTLLKRWQIETNIQAFLMHDAKYVVFKQVVSDEGLSMDQVQRTLSFEAASGYLAALLAAAVVAALLVFRRRDVN